MQATAREIAQLRHHAETVPISALAAVAARALEVIDAECWDSVNRGDTAAFAFQAALGAQLLEFGVCAGLRLEFSA
jgi:hypothetical protein